MTAVAATLSEPDSRAVVDGLVSRARVALAGFAAADQEQVDLAVTALAWSLYNPEHARELA